MGYRTRRGDEIHGVRVSALKALMKDEFGTVGAMAALGITEPDASQFLRKLEAEEILDYDGVQGGEERWKAGRNGKRILAATIAAPQPMAKATAALDKVLAAADAMLADPSASYHPTEIWLFGSALRGGDAEGLVGDVDIAVVAGPRLEGEEQRALERAEYGGWIPLYHMSWPYYRALSRLRAAARLVSVRSLHDAEGIDAQRQLVWRHDPATGTGDRTRGGIVGTTTRSPGPESERGESYESPSAMPAWREPPSQGNALTPRYRRLDDDARLARHMWARGEDLTLIAKRLETEVGQVRTLLTWDCRTIPLDEAASTLMEDANAILEVNLPNGHLVLDVLGRSPFRMFASNHVDSHHDIPPHLFAPAMALMQSLRTHLDWKWSQGRRRFDMNVQCVTGVHRGMSFPDAGAIRKVLEPLVTGAARRALDEDDEEGNYYALGEAKVVRGDTMLTVGRMPPSHRRSIRDTMPMPAALASAMDDHPHLRAISARCMLAS